MVIQLHMSRDLALDIVRNPCASQLRDMLAALLRDAIIDALFRETHDV